MIDVNHHNELLKSIPKPVSTLRAWLTIVFGWAVAIAIAAMGSVSFLSSN